MMFLLEDILKEDKLPPLVSRNANVTPFPQANSLDCVLSVLMHTSDAGVPLKAYVVENVVNSQRQASYYVNAAIYLGLCRRIGDLYYPTNDGVRLQNAKKEEREMLLASISLAHPIIGRWYSRVYSFSTYEERLTFVMTGFEGRLSKSTLVRRGQCVLSWLSWIQKHLPEL